MIDQQLRLPATVGALRFPWQAPRLITQICG